MIRLCKFESLNLTVVRVCFSECKPHDGLMDGWMKEREKCVETGRQQVKGWCVCSCDRKTARVMTDTSCGMQQN